MEKRTATYILVQAADFATALDNLNACMKGTMADWEVNSITETLLLDVYSYGASLPDAPKAQSPEKEVPLL